MTSQTPSAQNSAKKEGRLAFLKENLTISSDTTSIVANKAVSSVVSGVTTAFLAIFFNRFHFNSCV